MRNASVQNGAICIVRKPGKSGRSPSRKAPPVDAGIAAKRLLKAAAVCGLSPSQAADLLAETIACGVAIALSPERRAAIVAGLDRKTTALVKGRRTVRRAA